MCAICGVLRLHKHGGEVEANDIVRMRDAMIHRGPDDAGLYMSGDRRIGMGHRRLSIVDLSEAGRGPMSNEDGTIWISYNGEVYNHADLRKPLEAAGHIYRSRTDTETLLHLYEERGLDMVHELRGIFAFSIWDATRERLVIARDRLGVKPVYYTIAGGYLLWASEIKSLLTHPAVSADLNEDALVQYLTYAAVPAPDTLFAGIKKLAAGQMLVAERGNISVTQWWTPAGHDLPAGLATDDEAGIAEHLRELLTSSVTEQTMADVPHGVLLSGGVDSGLILSILSRTLREPVRTFSVGFEDNGHFDERFQARATAKQFGADHHEFVLEPHQVSGLIPELVYGQDEPISDWTCLPTMMLSRLVRDSGVVVVQVGEGSDELFAGYPRYRRYASLHDGIWSRYMLLPRVVRRGVNAVTANVLPGWKLLREPRDLFRRAAHDEPLFVSGAVVNWDDEKASLLSRSARARTTIGATSSELARRNLAHFHQSTPRGDFVSAMAYQDLMVRLPELLLMRVDKMTMLNSIEARVPFLDHRLVEFGMAVSGELKLKGGRTKHILKVAAQPLLNEDLLNRPKRGFDVPLAGWLRGNEVGGWAQSTVLNSGLLHRDFFDKSALQTLFRQHRDGSHDHGFRIWNLVNCCAWYDKWVCSKS